METYQIMPWFRKRLEEFLKEQHPQLSHKERIITRRSQLAARIYQSVIDDGSTEELAINEADRSLFRGLVFSKFDTICLTLATDFPMIPQDQRPQVARKLLSLCDPIFQTYNIRDDFASRPEFRQLRQELKISIGNWFDDNGIPGYKARLRNREKTKVSKSPFIPH